MEHRDQSRKLVGLADADLNTATQPVISYIGTKAARVQCLDALNIKFSTVAILKLDVQEFEDRVLASTTDARLIAVLLGQPSPTSRGPL
jgi:hypothetical protein